MNLSPSVGGADAGRMSLRGGEAVLSQFLRGQPFHLSIKPSHEAGSA